MDLRKIPQWEKRKTGVIGDDGILELTFPQLEHLWWQCIAQKSETSQQQLLNDDSAFKGLSAEERNELTTIAKATSSTRTEAKTGELAQGPPGENELTKNALTRTLTHSSSLKNLHKDTVKTLQVVPMHVRAEALARLDAEIKRIRRSKAARKFASTVLTQRVAYRAIQEQEKRRHMGFTITWCKRVQARWRMWVLRRNFLDYRQKVIAVQSRWRGIRTRSHIRDTLSNTVWETVQHNTVYISNILGPDLESASKLKAILNEALAAPAYKSDDGGDRSPAKARARARARAKAKGGRAARKAREAKAGRAGSGSGSGWSGDGAPIVLNVEMRVRDRPEPSWAIVTFTKTSSRKLVLDQTRKLWSDELTELVENAPDPTGAYAEYGRSNGLIFGTIDIDKALASTGAFGWTFKLAQKNVRKAIYKLHKERVKRMQHKEEMRQAKLRLEAQAGPETAAAGAVWVAAIAGGQIQRERVAARTALERAQCLCPLSRLPMRSPVVAADGFVYERAAISRWLAQKGLLSPVTGLPMPNALLIRHQALAAVAKETSAGSGSGSSSRLLHGYTASLRVTERLGVVTAAGGLPIWDVATTAVPNLADQSVAKAALRHGINVSKGRQTDAVNKARGATDPDEAAAAAEAKAARVAAAVAATEQAEDDHMVTPHGARSRSSDPGKCELTGRPGRSLRVVASSPGLGQAAPSAPGTPRNNGTTGKQRRASTPANVAGSSAGRRGSSGHAGNHGRGGLGGGGGSAALGMELSQAEMINLSPRFWNWPTSSSTPNRNGNGKGKGEQRAASPAAQVRAELAREHQRAVETARHPKAGTAGNRPIDGLVGFGSGSEVMRQPYFTPAASPHQVAEDAAARQAAAAARASAKHQQLLQAAQGQTGMPAPPPALWAQVDAEADADGQQQQAVAVSAARSGSAASDRAATDSAQLLEDWHTANDESSTANYGYEMTPMTQSTDARATLLEVSERSQD